VLETLEMVYGIMIFLSKVTIYNLIADLDLNTTLFTTLGLQIDWNLFMILELLSIPN